MGIAERAWDATAKHLVFAATTYVLAMALLRVGYAARWDRNAIGAVLATSPPA